MIYYSISIHNPLKPELPENATQECPVRTVIDLGHVKFDNNVTCSQYFQFPSQKNIFSAWPILHKVAIVLEYEFRQDQRQLEIQEFR